MFLASLLEKNQPFLQATIELHQRGELPANCYVIDLDTLESNTWVLVSEAKKHQLKVWAMTKQLGRGEPALAAINRGGADGFVAVDMDCARPIAVADFRLGHLGHLVQIPFHQSIQAAGLRPDYWTLYSLTKAERAERALEIVGREQQILLRVFSEGDIFYPGHEGGFPVGELATAVSRIEKLPHLQIAGVTSFPALLYNPESKQVETTPNLRTLQQARRQLASLLGKEPEQLQLNAPGTTSTHVLAQLAEGGATQVEPGHGLTGTTPLHAVTELPEKPAVLYLTEVSHLHQGTPFAFGGGFYLDPVFPDYQTRALVAHDPTELDTEPVPFTMPDPAGIDYYAKLHSPTNRTISEGATVIAGFRIQAFFTRALVAGLSGIEQEQLRVDGVWDDRGNLIT